MAYPLMYPYPYTYFSPPESQHVTYLHRSFPEHHLPFENARQKVTSGVHNIFHDPSPAPKADVRETLTNYYIDIELPGVESREQLKLKWTNSQTLYLEVEKKARAVVEGEDSKPAEGQQKDKPHNPVHTIVKERDLGKLKRAFDFPVPVDRETLDAKLHHGILEITLTKKDSNAPEKHEEIHVAHD